MAANFVCERFVALDHGLRDHHSTNRQSRRGRFSDGDLDIPDYTRLPDPYLITKSHRVLIRLARRLFCSLKSSSVCEVVNESAGKSRSRFQKAREKEARQQAIALIFIFPSHVHGNSSLLSAPRPRKDDIRTPTFVW